MALAHEQILDSLDGPVLGQKYGVQHLAPAVSAVPTVAHPSMGAPGNYLPVFLFGPQPSIWSQNHGGSSWQAQPQPQAQVMPLAPQMAPQMNQLNQMNQMNQIPLGQMGMGLDDGLYRVASVGSMNSMIPSPVEVVHQPNMAYPAMSLVIHPPAVPYLPPQTQQHHPQLNQLPYPYEPRHPVNHVIEPQTNTEPPVLDYDLQAMTEFIATIVQEAVFVPGEQAAPHVTWDLRMFLNSMLMATRLQRSTVLLSLAYLFRRWRLAPHSLRTTDVLEMKEFVVVGFMLANKINDDNTFTNASWAEASGLPARKLMAMEAQWLAAIKWSLTIDPEEWDAWDQFCSFQQTPGSLQPAQTGYGAPAPSPTANYPSPCMGHAGYFQEHSVAAF